MSKLKDIAGRVVGAVKGAAAKGAAAAKATLTATVAQRPTAPDFCYVVTGVVPMRVGGASTVTRKLRRHAIAWNREREMARRRRQMQRSMGRGLGVTL